ncbi:MAG: domain S-box protein, partial [Verrucomicrobiales bacterium]|nr:domain S-box protein [Verrucomicrobiales bacterium]
LHAAAAIPMIDPGQITKLQTWAASATANPLREPNVARSIERLIVEEYSPASVVINEQGEVVFFAGDTGKFLKPPAGSPNNKLVAMARENLRLELRTLIHRAVSSRKEAIRENLRLKWGRDNLHIDLIVRPLTELGPETGLYIVLFRELKLAEHAGFAPTEDFTSQEHPIIKQLEGELRTTRDDLQTTIEELETSNEELKSANEELLSMNEELQSANEEMQTSKEEVQSANDELQRKIQESDEANAELRLAQQERAEYAAIVQNSNDAIIGKTLGGIITSWNPAAERVFGYSADEMIGQSILRIIPPELHEEEERILQSLRRGDPVELYKTERLTKSGRVILVSLTSSPIRDAQGFIIGASKIARDITAQMAGVRASMLLAAVVDSSDDAIISKTLDGIVTSWNRAAEKMFGYAASEMIGQSITRLFPADRLQEEANVIARISRGERIEHFETIRKAKNGRQIEISLTISPIRDGTGKIIGASKIARDITAQKAATSSNLLLSAIVDSSDDAIISKTLDGIVTSWNYGAQKTFGYSAEEMIGQPITKLFPPDRLDEEIYVLSRIRNGQRIEHFETVRRAKDGTLLDISLTISPIKDAQGQIIGASKIARDVTVQKATTRASHLLASIVDSSDDAIISKRLDGIVTSWNKAAEKMFGYTAEEMIGNPVTRLFPDDRLEEEPKIVGRLANGERVEHFETIRKTKDGRHLDVSLTISPIRDSRGQIVGASKIARDISDALKIKRDLQEETGILELLNATGTAIASELNLESLVQQVTDAGTKLSGAKFGAFFYNVINEQGESFMLCSLSGAPREAFEKFGLPRNTPIFNPTFRGEGVVRSADITKDPRYGTMPPHHGMPKGHLPVCSYLAASVTSRSGEVIGGLFFGHPEPGVFSERAERLIVGLAAQAAVAIDNARLFEKARRSEASLQKAKDELEDKVSERTASLRETTEQLETFCYSVAHDLDLPCALSRVLRRH